MTQTPDDIQLCLAVHRTWLDSDRKHGEPANFAGKDLRFLDFSGLDLSGSIFDGANLERAALRDCKFVGASLQGTNLSLANVKGADFSGANLTRANLSDTVAVLSFESAILDAANMQRVRYPACRFMGASLQNADLRHALLEGADFSDANMASVELVSANLEGVLLNRSILDGGILDFAVLRKAVLSDVHAVIASFNRADLTDCVIEHGTFTLSHLEYATLIQASLLDTNFDGASLRGAIFSRATVENCSFQGADFRQAQTTGVNLESANLVGVKSDPNAIRYSGLIKAKLTAKQKGWLSRQRRWAELAANASAADAGSIGTGYSPELEYQLLALMKKRDELQQRLRRHPGIGQQDVGNDSAAIQADIDQIRDQRAILEGEIRREHETVRRQQGELHSRVSLAVDGLNIAVAPLNRHINSLRAWQWLTSGFGVAFLGLAVLRVALDLMRSDGIGQWVQTSVASSNAVIVGFAYGYGLAVQFLLLGAGVVSFWLASRVSQPLSHWVARRERLYQLIGVLVASQHVDFDINAKRSSVNQTFDAVRALLLDTEDALKQSN